MTLFDGIDVSGLLLAEIVLGATGALDDATITKASTMWELQEANPSLDRMGRFRGALRVGRDHIASMINTLLLACVGAVAASAHAVHPGPSVARYDREWRGCRR